MKQYCTVFKLVFLFAIIPLVAFGQDYRSKASGNWNDPSTWESFNGFSWVSAIVSPLLTSGVVTISSGHTVSVLTTLTADQIVVEAGGQLTVNIVALTLANGSGDDLVVYGTLRNDSSIVLNLGAAIVFKSGGKYQHNFTTIGGTIPNATWENGSTCEIIGYTNNTTPPGGLEQSFSNFTWNCPSQTSTIDSRSDSTIIRGNLSVSSTGSGSFAGTLKFSGTGSQTITSSGLVDSLDLIINNISGVVLNSALSINNLIFTLGNLFIGNYDLTIHGTVLGAAASKCVVTDGNGEVKRSIAASANFQFPIAPTSTSFNPLTIALNSGDPTEIFSIRVATGVSPFSDSGNSAVQRTWNISEATIGGNNATLTFQWIGSEEGSSYERSSAVLYRHNGTYWVPISSAAVTGTNPYMQQTAAPISGFSPWTSGRSGSLPVELTSFFATTNGFNVELRWATATETNNYGFDIERRFMQKNTVNSSNIWKKVSFVEGFGTSAVPKKYSFTDKNLTPGLYTYRIKQIDNNGIFKYVSETGVEVSHSPKKLYLNQNYPNPFNPSTKIEFTVPENGEVFVRLFNVVGQEVTTLFHDYAEAGRIHLATLDATSLTAGVYFVRLEFGQKHLVRKIMLLK